MPSSSLTATPIRASPTSSAAMRMPTSRLAARRPGGQATPVSSVPSERPICGTAAARVYDLRRVRARRGVNLTFDRATHALEAVRYQIDGRTLLVLEAQEDGTSAARRELLPYFVEVRGVAGRIERGLSEDAVEFGMPARVVSDLADIFGWDVDVAGDLRPGDEFRVVYEDIWQTGGTRPEPGNVLGAQIV